MAKTISAQNPREIIRTLVPYRNRHVRPLREIARNSMTVGATSVQAYMVLVVQVVDPMDCSARIIECENKDCDGSYREHMVISTQTWVVTRAVGIVLAARGILDMELRSCWTVRSRRTNLETSKYPPNNYYYCYYCCCYYYYYYFLTNPPGI
jgi:hypothetical protein